VCGTVLPTGERAFAYGRDGEILRCAWHGWEFEIATGRALVDPSVRARTFPVAVVDGAVVVTV
jgi:nitrite reductase/ring-hydroxylating ferredoxin subunit